ncbi:hypothetical protein D3C80_1232260 [compost metagenome]
MLVHGTGLGARAQRLVGRRLAGRQVLVDQWQQVEMAGQAELAELGHGLALVLEQALAQVPATVERPDQLAFRHPHVVEEHLAERRLAADQIDRRGLHPRALHVQHDKADALVLGRLEVGADQGVHPVGLVTVGGPDLGAVDQKIIAVFHGRGFQTGKVRAGIGLGETLAPTHFATAHGRQQGQLLCFAGELQQHRPEHPDAQVDLRRPAFEAAQLAFKHCVFLGAQAATAVFLRPLRAKPALVAHTLEPQAGVFAGEFNLAGAPDHLAFRDSGALRRRAVVLQPGARRLSELLDCAHSFTKKGRYCCS